MNTFPNFKKFSASLILFTLAACGGGTDNDSDALEKYLGTWTSVCSANGDGTSSKYDVTLTKTGSNTGLATGIDYKYNTTNCTGTSSFEYWVNLLTIKGQKTVDGLTVDKIELKDEDGEISKDIFAIQGSQFISGDGTPDTEGYPTTLDKNNYLEKSNNASTNSFAKYAGKWKSTCEQENNRSYISYIDIVENGSNTSLAKGTEYAYNTTNCTGASSVNKFTTILTIRGQKTVDGLTVDKVDAKETNGDISKKIFTIKDGKIMLGEEGTLDTSGYPTSIDTSYYLFRHEGLPTDGGGSGETPSVVDKYVGTWLSKCLIEPNKSYKMERTVTKINSTSASFSTKEYSYTTQDCTGTPSIHPSGGTILFTGTKIVDGIAVDRVEGTENGYEIKFKDIVTIKDGYLLTGDEGAPLDEIGYPSKLDYGHTPVPTTSVVDKYLGTWKTKCLIELGKSYEAEVTFTKISSISASYSTIRYFYDNTDCTGTPTINDSWAGINVFIGTKIIDGVTVDMLEGTDIEDNSKYKDILTIQSGNLLLGGDLNAPFDAAGYPNKLDYDYYLTKF